MNTQIIKIKPAPVRKVIIPAAGWGTRFLPMTKVVHKELVPVLNKPIIHYLAKEAAQAGIEEIILVISPRKLEILQYFTTNQLLENELREKGKIQLLGLVSDTNNIAKVSIAIQNQQLGLGHALSVASDLVGNEPFAVILGDDLISSDKPAIGQLIKAYNQTGCSILGVQSVDLKDVSKYGIVEPLNPKEKNKKMFKIKTAVEKPSVDVAPSNKAILGRYVFTPRFMDALNKIKKGWNAKTNGELNVVDAFPLVMKEEDILAFEFDGKRYDLGSMEGFVKANIDYALKDEEISDSIKKHIQKVVDKK